MQAEDNSSSTKSKKKSLTNESIKKYSKLVNLRKNEVDLTEKQ